MNHCVSVICMESLPTRTSFSLQSRRWLWPGRKERSTGKQDTIREQVLGHLVRVRSTPHSAYTSRLSTRSSSGDLTNSCCGGSHLGACFALRCFQRLSLPDVATQHLRLAAQLIHQRSVQPGPLVLGSAPLKTSAPTADRDRTVSRRSEPSSRTALMGEQPNPWELIHPQDATSRHRGAKPCRRCERLGKISLLSPG